MSTTDQTSLDQSTGPGPSRLSLAGSPIALKAKKPRQTAHERVDEIGAAILMKLGLLIDVVKASIFATLLIILTVGDTVASVDIAIKPRTSTPQACSSWLVSLKCSTGRTPTTLCDELVALSLVEL